MELLQALRHGCHWSTGFSKVSHNQLPRSLGHNLFHSGGWKHKSILLARCSLNLICLTKTLNRASLALIDYATDSKALAVFHFYHVDRHDSTLRSTVPAMIALVVLAHRFHSTAAVQYPWETDFLDLTSTSKDRFRVLLQMVPSSVSITAFRVLRRNSLDSRNGVLPFTMAMRNQVSSTGSKIACLLFNVWWFPNQVAIGSLDPISDTGG